MPYAECPRHVSDQRGAEFRIIYFYLIENKKFTTQLMPLVWTPGSGVHELAFVFRLRKVHQAKPKKVQSISKYNLLEIAFEA